MSTCTQGIGVSHRKTKQSSAKNLQATSLGYSNVKFTIKESANVLFCFCLYRSKHQKGQKALLKFFAKDLHLLLIL